MEQTEGFKQWCILELMGRQQVAGYVSEQVIAGQGFLRVDVPDTKRTPAFTRFIAPGSLYAINPVTEEVARKKAELLHVQPIEEWDIHKFMQKVEDQRLLNKSEYAGPMSDRDDYVEDDQ